MPEQRAEVRTLVIGWDDEAPVHIGMPARLEAQQLTHHIGVRVRLRIGAPLPHTGPGQVRGAVDHDAEGLTGGVVVLRADAHRARVCPIQFAVLRDDSPTQQASCPGELPLGD